MSAEVQTKVHVAQIFSPVGTGLLQRMYTLSNTPGLVKDRSKRDEEELTRQRSSVNHAGAVTAPLIVHEVLRSQGRPLDPATRTFMEPRFGHDFSRVRVHTDAKAAESARAVNALAYTVGEHVVFGSGQYVPHTATGRQLAVHELAHVVQQSQGGAETISPSQSARLEQDAQTAASATAGSALRISIYCSSAPRIARAPEPGGENISELRYDGLTDPECKLLNKVRDRLVPASKRSTAIVGVLIAEDGRQFEFTSGGGQGFSSHVEGKATAKMEELGITKATLLIEKEPCQICDRSVYSQETGPETPLKSSRTGKDLSRQTPKINTALRVGTELTVVDPESASYYRGVKPAPPPVVPGSGGKGKKPDTSAAGGGLSVKPKQDASKQAGPAPKTSVAETAVVPRTGTAPKAGAGAGGPGVATGGATSEARMAARTAAKELSADFKILRVAKGLSAAIRIVSFIAALSMLDSFTKITMSSLAGEGFILTKEIAEAKELDRKASALKRDYFPFSEKLYEKWLNFFRAAQDPLSAGLAASSISDLDIALYYLKLDLPEQIARVNAALKEAEVKQKAAEAILNDPKASAAIAMCTLSTAELAMLFAASQDMSRIAGALRSASANLTKVKNKVDEDFEFIHGWFQALFEVCREGGQCWLHILPAEAGEE